MNPDRRTFGACLGLLGSLWPWREKVTERKPGNLKDFSEFLKDKCPVVRRDVGYCSPTIRRPSHKGAPIVDLQEMKPGYRVIAEIWDFPEIDGVSADVVHAFEDWTIVSVHDDHVMVVVNNSIDCHSPLS